MRQEDNHEWLVGNDMEKSRLQSKENCAKLTLRRDLNRYFVNTSVGLITTPTTSVCTYKPNGYRTEEVFCIIKEEQKEQTCELNM
jgi:hypothetical protein